MDYYVPNFGVDTDIKTSLNNMNTLEYIHDVKGERDLDEEDEEDVGSKLTAKKVAADVETFGATAQKLKKQDKDKSRSDDAEEQKKAQEVEEKATADKSEDEKEAEAEKVEEKKAKVVDDAEKAEKRASKKRAMKKLAKKTGAKKEKNDEKLSKKKQTESFIPPELLGLSQETNVPRV